ncbi:MAG: hypothetical protein RIG82_10540 [Phycisphaeraceae bacterium]
MGRQLLISGIILFSTLAGGCVRYQQIGAEEFIERYEAERNVYAYHEYEGVFLLHHHLSYYTWIELGSNVGREVIYTCPRSELPENFPMRPQRDIDPWRPDPRPPGLMHFDSGLEEKIDWSIPETRLGL